MRYCAMISYDFWFTQLPHTFQFLGSCLPHFAILTAFGGFNFNALAAGEVAANGTQNPSGKNGENMKATGKTWEIIGKWTKSPTFFHNLAKGSNLQKNHEKYLAAGFFWLQI